MRWCRAVLVALVLLSATGCATRIRGWIVTTRDHQGDVALVRGQLNDASLAYRLALAVAPNDQHARQGLTAVQLALAADLFRASKFDDALNALALAAKYDPQSVRLGELRSEIEQAKIRRLIVLSNYPAYKESAIALRRAYLDLIAMNRHVVTDLAQFSYTYDTAQLTRAIRGSYELAAEVERNTKRLITFRQLVESGIPNGASASLAPPASLLPLP